jgi:hypothetical protein
MKGLEKAREKMYFSAVLYIIDRVESMGVGMG